LLHSMKTNAIFINTARGAIVREEELIEVMKKRSDLTAILDVTHPEPPAEDSPLFDLDNVVVTPHIAGSAGSETERLGAFMLEEAKRYVNGKPLEYRIAKESYARMA
uniref:NAD(P)-dependent oxidoreductase n=1 Tax=Atopococcus tabaci TaxID=269774 RepID=UPI0024090AAC